MNFCNLKTNAHYSHFQGILFIKEKLCEGHVQSQENIFLFPIIKFTFFLLKTKDLSKAKFSLKAKIST